MNDTSQKKNAESKSNMVNAVISGVAGVVAGGAAVAAVFALSDKKNQQKVVDAIDDAKGKVTEYAETVKSQPTIKKGAQKVEEVVQTVKQKFEEKA